MPEPLRGGSNRFDSAGNAMAFLGKLFGDEQSKFLRRAHDLVDEINKLEADFEGRTEAELRAHAESIRTLLEGEGDTNAVLPEVFALTRESAKRTLGQRHYDVQLIGGIALHEGMIAEMRTGEGKTLASTLPLVLNALTGKGAHLVTVNDYLARRDGVWMGQIYHYLGLSVGVIGHDAAYRYDPAHTTVREDAERDTTGAFRVQHEFLRPVTRAEAYAADITYGTNNEFGFDYLRDNLVYETERMVHRPAQAHPWHFAIVDEVDSILIDEARTPLIISSPDVASEKLYETFARIVPKLKKDTHYTLDEKGRAALITEEGIAEVERALGIENLYEEGGVRMVHHLEQALKAHVLFQRDKHYVVRDGEVVIVDEFTGRMMPGRRYSEGLHQAIEAKEGVEVQRESRTVATITFQNYFRLYQKLAGMTGTARSSEEEFFRVYGREVVSIPTHRPMVRKDHSDKVYRSEMGKFRAVVSEIEEHHRRGRPVLLGTVSIEKNEYVSFLLKKHGIPHRLLNAKNHEEEAAIIAQAGRYGAVTVATNMAGRGVDIILGGNPSDPEEAEKVRSLGGLHVIGTERHEARRIDNQLRGRAGRQGDPGSSQFFVSLEDDLMRVFGGDRVKAMMTRLNIPEDEAIQSSIVSKAIESAQSRIEGYHFDIRKHVLEYDEVINRHRAAIYRMRREVLQPDPPGANRQKIREMLSESLDDTVASAADEYGIVAEQPLLEAVGHLLSLDTRGVQSIKKEIAGKTVPEALEALEKIFNAAYEARRKDLGEDALDAVERSILLRVIDEFWMDHLSHMDYVKSSIGLRAYGQRDPLVEYKTESKRIFEQMLAGIRGRVSELIFRVSVTRTPEMARPLVYQGPAKTQGGGAAPSGSVGRTQGKKIGRNDPCPCGSGKKWKHCGLINSEEHQRNMSTKK
jgi:preprotein translocase subunit SecA